MADGELTVDHKEQFGRRVAVRRGAGARRDFDLYSSRFEPVRPPRKRTLAPAKLLAYLHSRLGTGRQSGLRPQGTMSLTYGDIEMQLETHHVRCNGRELLLGPIEFKLLRHMLENPEKVFSRDELIEAAWPGNVYVGPRTVDVHISRLRKSSGSHPIAIPSEPSGSVGIALESRTF